MDILGVPTPRTCLERPALSRHRPRFVLRSDQSVALSIGSDQYVDRVAWKSQANRWNH
jgi:hypothetical protein